MKAIRKYAWAMVWVLALFTLVQTCTPPTVETRKNGTMQIIPEPRFMAPLPGKFTFGKTVNLYLEDQDEDSEFLLSYLEALLPNHRISSRNRAQISLVVDTDADLPAEGYQLTVEKKGIHITAGGEAGLFYGIQTLRQMLPAGVESGPVDLKGWQIPAVRIIDFPRFSWRGMHLDVSRHFFPPEFIKRYIDMIAFHKMNVFHWHLTDDNGWRLEIKRYPKLTEVCAWRVDRESEDWRKWSPIKPGEPATYGGFYTQDEVRDIVAYAAQRQITVIPEIEMPGHSSEIFAAYPELSCQGKTLPVRPGSYWPNEDILCAGNDSVFTFLQNIIDEVVELFPSEYIHIGGDEARKTYWKTCPKCQARIREEGLANEKELQSWFIQRMEKYIHSKGKRLIGWDEILEGGLAPDATVMSWRGEKGGIAAAKADHDVIMTPTSHVYFDHYQGDPATEPQAIGGYLPLVKVYAYEPIPAALPVDKQQHVLGAQANLWTEFIKTPQHAEYMALPRMTALSEVLWSGSEQRDWESFQQRLGKLSQRFDALGWNYKRDAAAVPLEKPAPKDR